MEQPKHSASPELFQPLTIKSVTFQNRIVVSPMCQYSSVDGMANDWHLVHLGSRAVGGAGLILLEATAVEPRGRISPDDLGLWDDAHIQPLQRITRFLKEHGAVPGIQLAHAGRKGSTYAPWKGKGAIPLEDGGWNVVSASSLPYAEHFHVPHALTSDEIQEIVTCFRDAARRAYEAGFEVVEIHAAHGYLLHQFLSPYTNDRDDVYGGSLANRARFLLEVIKAVQSVWPKDFPLWVRISATDWLEHLSVPSWTLEDSVALCQMLKDAGVDVIDVSSGGNSPKQKIKVQPGYQVPFAETIKRKVGIRTAAVGLITEPEQAESILQKKQADLIALGREFLRQPYFPLHASKQLGADIRWPAQYERAKR